METLLPRSRISERTTTSSRRAATGGANTRGVLRDVSVNTQASQDNRKRKAAAQKVFVLFFFCLFLFFVLFLFCFLFCVLDFLFFFGLGLSFNLEIPSLFLSLPPSSPSTSHLLPPPSPTKKQTGKKENSTANCQPTKKPRHAGTNQNLGPLISVTAPPPKATKKSTQKTETKRVTTRSQKAAGREESVVEGSSYLDMSVTEVFDFFFFFSCSFFFFFCSFFFLVLFFSFFLLLTITNRNPSLKILIWKTLEKHTLSLNMPTTSSFI